MLYPLLAVLAAATALLDVAAVLPPVLWPAVLWPTVLRGPAPPEVAVAIFAAGPRWAVAMLAGAALGLSGGLLQAALRNRLASPNTLGIAAGAQLALAAATLYAPALLAGLGRDAVALSGALLAAGTVLLLGARKGMAPLTVLLCGLLVALACGSVAGVLTLLHSRQLSGLFVWAGGSLVQDGWGVASSLFWRFLLGAAVTAVLLRPLRLLELPDAAAAGVGVSVAAVRFGAVAVAVGLSASVVASVGVIGFVGLAAPALAGFGGGRFSPARCAALGAVLLAVTDGLVARLAGLTPDLLPTGAVTALLGAPLLLLLLLRLVPAGGEGPAPPGIPALSLRPARVFAVLAVSLVLAVAAALLLARGDDGWSVGTAFFALRWPRTAGAALAGAQLGIAGLLLQRVLRNPVASPDVIGIGTGTTVGLAAALWFGTAGPAARLLAGAAGGAATAGLLLLFGRGGAAPARMLLAGLAVGSAFEGLLAFLLATGDPRSEALLLFLSGTTYFLDGPLVAGAALCLLLAGGAALALRRPLDALLLGEVTATATGVPVGRVRVLLLLLAAALAGTATLLAGPLSFAGLAAPHAARLLGLRRGTALLCGAALLGALLLVVADWAGRNVLYPSELPAGSVAALFGAPFLILALLRRR